MNSTLMNPWSPVLATTCGRHHSRLSLNLLTHVWSTRCFWTHFLAHINKRINPKQSPTDHTSWPTQITQYTLMYPPFPVLTTTHGRHHSIVSLHLLTYSWSKEDCRSHLLTHMNNTIHPDEFPHILSLQPHVADTMVGCPFTYLLTPEVKKAA